MAQCAQNGNGFCSNAAMRYEQGSPANCPIGPDDDAMEVVDWPRRS